MSADQHGTDDYPGSSGGGSASVDLVVRTVTGPDSVQPTDRVIWLDAGAGAFTFTLSSAGQRPGRQLTLKRVNDGANVPSVAALDGETVERVASLPFIGLGDAMDLIASGGTDWRQH